MGHLYHSYVSHYQRVDYTDYKANNYGLWLVDYTDYKANSYGLWLVGYTDYKANYTYYNTHLQMKMAIEVVDFPIRNGDVP